MNNKSFIKGLVVCTALMIAVGGGLFLLNHGHNRPEGVAEDWLTAIGDTTRKGVEADATRRADKIGAPELAIRILEPQPEAIDRKAGFEDLEVGKAARLSEVDGSAVRVAFHVTARRPADKTEEVNGVLTLVKEAGDDKWTVTALDVIDPKVAGVPELPSNGGPPPSSAPVSLWLGALVGAALVGLVTTALVRAASPAAPAPAAV
ncbi:MAG: hypothetical protein H0U92_06390 [Actinobacteria bacterium]|nr:hypothetical protein [Actinomycetota bacterium]